jgi:hypothetical protein
VVKGWLFFARSIEVTEVAKAWLFFARSTEVTEGLQKEMQICHLASSL